MNKNKKGVKVFRSQSEFLNTYFLHHAPKHIIENTEEARIYGAKTAIESLKKISLNM